MKLVTPGQPLYCYVKKSIGRIAVSIIFQSRYEELPTIGRERRSALLAQTGSDVAEQPMGRYTDRGQLRAVMRSVLFEVNIGGINLYHADIQGSQPFN